MTPRGTDRPPRSTERGLSMNLQQLRYFLAACRLQNISRASESLNISQPSVSTAIKNLESEFGVKLIRRQRNGFTLTPEGEEFQQLAKELIDHADRVSSVMCDKGSKHTPIRFGMPPMAGSILFPMIYADFRPSHPEIEFSSFEAGRRELLRQIDDNQIDLAFLPHDTPLSEEYGARPVLRLETMLCVSDRHPLANRTSVLAEDLENEPIVIFSNGFLQNKRITSFFAKAGIVPHIIHDSTQLSTVERLVSDGIAAGFLFRELADQLPHVVSIPLAPPLYTQISLIWRKGRYLTHDMKAFIGFFDRNIT